MKNPAMVLVAIAAMLSARSSSAEDLTAGQRLERARVCSAALDFDCAARELEALRLEDLTPEDRVEALRLHAETCLALNRLDEAERHLLSLLEIRPDWSPQAGSWPPKWLDVLEKARRLAPDRLPPVIRGVEVSDAVEGEPVEFRVFIEDPSGVGGATLSVLPGAPPIRLKTTDGRTWVGVVPGEWVRAPALAYSIEAVDTLGNGPVRVGSEEAREIPVAARPAAPTPVVRRAWFWAAIAAGAALVGTGIYFWTRSRDASTAAGSGRGDLRVEGIWPTAFESR